MNTKISHILWVAALAFVVQSCSTEPKETEPEKETFTALVVLEEAETKPFKHEISVQGNVETDLDALLSAEMGGLITSINIKEGQRVSKGQTLARVDASILNSNMQELKTQLEYAEYMLGKQKELKARGVGSEFDLETAQSQVNALKASMNSLSTQQGKTVIKAPFSGVIDQVFAKNGQMASPAAPIARLVNNSKVDIIASISEKHLAKVKVGTPINVSFPNYMDSTYSLTVTNVGNYIEPTNRTFRIISSIDKNTLLLPNMLAEVKITDLQVDNGLVIPAKSILKDQQSNDYIYVAKKGKKKNEFTVSKVIIDVIQRYNGEALIESKDVTSGDKIVTDGAKGIRDGNTVRTNK